MVVRRLRHDFEAVLASASAVSSQASSPGGTHSPMCPPMASHSVGLIVYFTPNSRAVAMTMGAMPGTCGWATCGKRWCTA